jgi:23S rRNA pseudouridine1911/1915/1917 synthase
MPSEHQFHVGEGDAGTRLDKWLLERLKGFSRNQVKRLLDDGRVLVNRRRVLIAGWELIPGDDVEVRMPLRMDEEVETGEGAQDEGQGQIQKREVHRERQEHSHIAKSIDRHLSRRREERREEKETRDKRHDRLKVYYEDRDIIVVEKPVNTYAVPDEKGNAKDDLFSLVKEYLKRKHGGKGAFVSAVHRLDADTSGIMVFALSNDGKKIEEQFRQHSIRREYMAIVDGRVDSDGGVIKKAVEKGRFHGGKKAKVSAGGKEAVTEFRVVERYKDATLLRVNVKTGRTHQIRVHMASEGHPVIGDRVYGGSSHRTDIKRQALHAHMIGFRHPKTGKKLQFQSPLPKDMKDFLDKLRVGA